MDLKTYLKRKRMTAEKFAKIAGLSKQSVCNYLRKDRLPDTLSVYQIEKATDGAVTIVDVIQYFKSGKEEK